jgi:hypothetical protein
VRGVFLGLSMLLAAVTGLLGQSMPRTPAETLSGKRIVLAEALRGHAAVLVMGFTRAGGSACDPWARALRADPSMAGIAVFQAAMLEGAPGWLRAAIKSSMRKGLSPAEQDNFVILVQDGKLWRSYFGVTADQDPYVVLLDAAGQVRWHGHGAARDLEPLLKAALK